MTEFEPKKELLMQVFPTPKKPFDTRHILTFESGLISDVLHHQLEIPTERVKELLNLGSVYVEGHRHTQDSHVDVGTHMRVHLKPKRYDVSQFQWGPRIIERTEHFMVVNKPKNIPVHPMVDNLHENMIHQLSLYIGQPVYLTHRLDILTEGLIVVGLSKEFQKSFNGVLARRKIEKLYRAWTRNPVSLGLHVHFMEPTMGSPKRVENEPGGETWQKCELNVLSCKSDQDRFAIDIELLTGRTHQIRAQLGKLGSPICGDRIYGSHEPEENFQLVARKLSFSCPITRQRVLHELLTP